MLLWQNPSMDYKPPSESDYTTSTNPERFVAVIEFAKSLISGLESEFVVDRTEGDWAEDFPRLADWNEDSAAPIRLTPAIGVPLVLGFTSAPGVVIRVGRNVQELFPSCLCDACNSQVSDECDRLQMHVEAATIGGFTEEVNRRTHRWVFKASNGNETSSVSRLERGEWKRMGSRGKYNWEPWTRKGK